MCFPLIASLARRVLAVPATSAQSERLCSAAGLLVTEKRASLGHENVEMLLLLRTVWPVMDCIMEEEQAGVRAKRK